MPPHRRAYRSKRVKPCDACRRRKIACIQEFDESGKVRACSLCKHRNVACTFLSGPGRRRKQSLARSEESAEPADALTPPGSESTGIGSTGNDMVSTPSLSLEPYPNTSLEQSISSASISKSYSGSDLYTTPPLSGSTGSGGEYKDLQNGAYDAYDNGHFKDTGLHGITAALASQEQELLDLYYEHVHPALPILEKREVFEEKMASGVIPTHLIVLVLLHGAHHCPETQSYAELLCRDAGLEQKIPLLLAFEACRASLSTIQAGLLFLEHPFVKRQSDPNQSQYWGLHATMVATAQRIGLHMDSPRNADGALLPEDKRLRRIVWWSLFVRDKWMSYLLRLPSHIPNGSWITPPLVLTDFSDAQDCLSVKAISWGSSLIALVNLTLLLSDVLQAFYSQSRLIENLDPSLSIGQGLELIQRLAQWRQGHPFVTDSTEAHPYTAQLLSYSVCLAIHFGLVATYQSVQSNEASVLAENVTKSIRKDLLTLLRTLKQRAPKGLWLSFNAGSMLSIAEALEPVVLASRDEATWRDRSALLDELEAHLKELLFIDIQPGQSEGSGLFDFVRPSLQRISDLRTALFMK